MNTIRYIIYRIRLLEPVLVTALDGDPNSAVALNYLPGSVLRGLLIELYLRQRGRVTSLADDQAFRQLFFDGSTRFLNGYVVENNQRTLPTPLSWHTLKGELWPLQDFAVEPPPFDPQQQWQGVPKPFCLLTKRFESHEADVDDEESETLTAYHRDRVRLCAPEKLLQVHTNRERRSGRPRADEGAVYRYESLAAEQTFEAAILWEREADTAEDRQQFADFCSLMEGEFRLGGARSAGYGQARFEGAISTPEEWHEAPRGQAEQASGKLILTLLSDALVRDEYGQFTTDRQAVGTAFAQKLGCSLSEPEVFARATLVGGFNRKWGLPLPQTLAVRMGSTYVFDDPACDESLLTALERSSFGERRAEGFGRVAVNWLRNGELKEADGPEKEPYQAITLNDEAASRQAQMMVQRMLRQKLDAVVLSKAGTVAIPSAPHKSQLSRLRETIREGLLRPTPSLQPLTNYLNDIQQRKAARVQFERARLDEKNWLAWLNEQAGLTAQEAWENKFWNRLNRLPAIGSVRAEITPTLRSEYLLRYLDAVIVRAIKQQSADNEAQEDRRDG